MKIIISTIFVLYISIAFSQKIEKREGKFKITKKEVNLDVKKKIPKTEFYFNESGKILEKISYGKPHSAKLNIIGRIEQFTYRNDTLQVIDEYVSDCIACFFYHYKTVCAYDKGNLIRERTYRGETDSLFMELQFEYASNLKKIHSNSTTYIENKYDDENRIVEQNQLFEESKKLRWQRKYVYAGYITVSKLQTYYGDGNENAEIEILTYSSNDKLISKETIHEKTKNKLYYFYSPFNGLIEKIEHYESFDDGKYKLTWLTQYKSRNANKISSITSVKINQELIDQTSI